MPDLLVRNAGRVFGRELEGPTCIVVSQGRVAGFVAESQFGSDSLREVAPLDLSATPELDARGRAVIPGFVDAHTHLVFAGDRSQEFDARLKGSAYQAGGIMSSVRATRAATTEELTRGVTERADKCLDGGTTTIEVKSGYGLDVDSERRSLQAIAEAAKHTSADLVPTFLGAHLDPEPGYIDMLINDMLPACAPLAESCDSFCDVGAVSVEDSRKVLEAGRRHGLVSRIHAEELAHTGGAALAAELRCASADHLVHATDEDARALAAAGVVAVLLPATSFCLRSSYAPARKLVDAGATVALATDCNPGTSYTTSMSFVIAVACSEYAMSVEEAVTAATRGGAAALRRHDIGHLAVGARADMVVIDGDHWVDIAYHPGMDVIGHVVKGGIVVR
ncbi:MAG: imidazolonepropionase [Acidimicrobiales bacterium]